MEAKCDGCRRKVGYQALAIELRRRVGELTTLQLALIFAENSFIDFSAFVLWPKPDRTRGLIGQRGALGLPYGQASASNRRLDKIRMANDCLLPGIT